MLKRGLFLVMLLAFWLAPTKVQAAGADFTVTPDTHASQKAGYFQYQLQPGQTTTLRATITNTAATTRRFQLSVVSAGVSADGRLTYTPGAKLTKDAGPSLQSLFTPARQTVSIAANSSQVVTTDLRVPETSWHGERLGALSVVALPTKAEKAKTGIQNRFVMATPIHVTIAKPVSTRPKLSLANAKLNDELITADLANHTPRLFGAITMATSLIGPNKEVVTTGKLEDAQMAPNAIMPVQLPATKALTPGTYTLRVQLTSGKQQYDLKTEFAISAAAAKATASKQASSKLPAWVYALLGVIALLLAIILWLLWRQRRQKHDAN